MAFPRPEIISEQVRDEYLNHGFNSLAPGEDLAEYKAEWRAVYGRLKEAVSRRAAHGVGEDLLVDGDCVPDRFLCVEIAKQSALTPELLIDVWNLLQGLDKDYSIDICDAWGFLKTEADEEHPHFNIFVERRRILIFSESPSILERLGLSR
jgi:hypothetical protein